MDPDAKLAHFRKLVDWLDHAGPQDPVVGDLVSTLDDLDAWLSRDGTLPTAWQR